MTMENFGTIFREIENTDILHGLKCKSLLVSADSIRWVSVPKIESSNYPISVYKDFYYYMALTRKVDEEIAKLFRKGLAFGKHLSSIGNEATSVGATYALEKNDWVATAIRDLGVFIVRRTPIEKILGQACGRINGFTKGWDGSLHMGDKNAKIAGLISHLGTMVPIASGCAFAEKYKETRNVALVFCGDGTTSSGDVHEALNIASVLELPMVVVVENNQWAFGTPNRFEFHVPTLALRALGYGRNVRGCWIDGTQILTVYETVRESVEIARKQNITTIIESVSMRLEGHSLVDPFNTYVPSEQLEEWRKKDPIESYANILLANRILTPNQLEEIDLRIKEEVLESALATEKSGPPDTKNIEGLVFVSLSNHSTEITCSPPGGRNITYHQAIRETIKGEMEQDPDLFIIGEDIGISHGAFKITEGFLKHFDEIDWQKQWKEKNLLRKRIIDAPLAESGFCGLALGAVLAGLKAIVEFQYADFSSEAYKMLVNYASTQTARGFGPCNIVFRLPSGWASSASAYHSINPESWFASTPGLKIVAPITAFDAKGLLRAAIRDGNPVLYLEYKNYYRLKPESLPSQLNLLVPEYDYVVPIGRARVIKKGTNLTIVSYGSQLFRVIEAVSEIEKENNEIDIEIIDLRTVIPYDKIAVSASVRKTGRAIVTCEAPRTGCFGNTVVTDIIKNDFEYLDAPVILVAAADTPVPFAKELEEAHLPTTEKLISAIKNLMSY